MGGGDSLIIQVDNTQAGATGGNNTITNAGANPFSVNTSGGGAISMTAGGTIDLTSVTLNGTAGGVSLNGSGITTGVITAVGGTVTLTSTGTVTQTAALSGTTLDLRGAGGVFTLNTKNNAFTNLKADTNALTSLAYRNDAGFAVQGVNTTGNTTLSSTGAVTQSGVITAAGLELLGAGGTYTLNTQNNAITTLAGNTGTVLFQDNTGFAVGTVNTAGLTATVGATLSSTGTVTQTAAGVITTPTLTLTGAGGTFNLATANNAVTTLDADNSALTQLQFQGNTGFDVAGVNTTGNTTLSSTGAVTQSGVITAAGLELLGAGGTYTLNTQNNAITTLAGNTGTVLFQDNTGFAVGTVNTAGLTATVGATLSSTGTVTQTAAGVITTPTLTLTGAGGTFNLATANNAVTTLDANNTTIATLTFKDDTGYAVAGVDATGAVTLESAGGTVTQSAPINATTLTVLGAGGTFNLGTQNNSITTLDADNTSITSVSLQDNTGFDVAGTNATGNVTLNSTGAVTQSGVITAAGLELLGAGGTYTLNTQNNAITTLAGNTGTVLFQDNTGFAVGTVNTAGLTATVGATLSSTGTVTQTAAGVITTPTLTLTGAGGTFNLATANNAVTTLDADNSALTQLQFQGNTGFDVAGVNTTGNTTLSSTGAVTQSGVITAAGLELLGAGGTYTLNTQNNAITTLAGNTGTVLFQDNTGFAVGTVNTAGLTATVGATLSSTGTVTQTAAGVITTPTLTLTGAGGTFNLATANNAVTTLDANNTTIATLTFKDDTGYAVAGVDATGAVTLESAGGTVTQSAPINATTLTVLGAGGTFNLGTQNNSITTLDADNTSITSVSLQDNTGFDVAGTNATGNVTLNSTGAVTQSGVITAAGLELLGAGGTYTLNTQNNAITTLAGNTGTVLFQDNTGFAVGTVNTAGLTATVGATLSSTGTVTQTAAGVITTPTLTLTGAGGTFNLATANNAVTTLDADNSALTQLQFQGNTGFDVAGVNTTGNTTLSSTGAVTQSGVITAAGLELLGAGGTYTLNTQNNAITTLAGNTGTVLFQDNTGFAVGTVNTAGLTATVGATLSSTGTVTQTAAGVITTPTLTLTGAGGTFNLATANNAVTTLDADNSALTQLQFQGNTGFDVAGVNTTGNTTLSSTGAVTQSGVITAAGLELLGAGGTYTLNTQNNAITTLAGNTGTVLFQDNTGFAVGTVNTAGLTATVGATLSSTGTVTQTAAGVITTPTLTLTGAGGTFNLATANNAVTTLDANNTTIATLTFKDDTGYAVAGVDATGAVTLESAGGTVTQSAPINATTLTVLGAGGTFNLGTQNNSITTLDADNTSITSVSLQDNTGFDVAGTNATGNVTLNSTGAVTQSGVITAAGLELLGAGGTYTLNTQNNAITTLAGNTGTVLFQDNTGFAVGTVNTAGLTATVGATLSSTGTVTQTAAITAPTLVLNGAGGTFALNGATNALTNLGAVTLGSGSLNLLDAGGLTVSGAVAANGGVTINTSGSLAIPNSVSSTGAISLTAGQDVTTSAAISGASVNILFGQSTCGDVHRECRNDVCRGRNGHRWK